MADIFYPQGQNMLNEMEAQSLMNKLIALRNELKTNDSEDLINEYKKHEKLCIDKFKYLVTMRTGRYKNFHNYDDLNQEGFEALLKAMKNYDPIKGSFFWWCHKYIDTRISRSANLHTTIRFPLKYAKLITPHRESILPVIVETRHSPDKNVEDTQTAVAINNAMNSLAEEEKTIIHFAFGFDGGKPLSINKICKKMNMSRLNCIKAINNALNNLKQNIQL